MRLVDFILNLAGLLLWVKWRSLPFDPFQRRTPATLVGTLRRAAPSHFRRWHLLAGIAALLLLRALFYWQIGSAFTPVWVGKVNLEPTVLTFVSNSLGRMLVFSLFSFAQAFGILYLWLLLLSLLTGPAAMEHPLQRMVRQQLGRIAAWPRWSKLLLPWAATALAWGVVSWPFGWLHPQTAMSATHRLAESLIIGLGSYLAWKPLAAGLLGLRLLNTYVYFGRHSFWNEVQLTSQILLAPLRRLPLRVGRADLAPAAGILLVWVAADLAERGLAHLYARVFF